MKEKLAEILSRYSSRKFLALIAGVGIIFIDKGLGLHLSDFQYGVVGSFIITYMGVQGTIDFKKASSTIELLQQAIRELQGSVNDNQSTTITVTPPEDGKKDSTSVNVTNEDVMPSKELKKSKKA